jgi:outer membrane murein-binding lipoprotein Lpp
MKKLFSILLVLVAVVTLTGCSNSDLESQIDTLEADLIALQAQYDALVSDYEDRGVSLNQEVETNELLEEQITALEEQIEALQELVFDNVITITLSDSYGMFSSKTVGFNDDFEGSLFDLLEAHFEVGYYDTEYGKMITSLDYVETQYGNYIAFYKNGEASFVGVEAADFNNDDVFHFELAWWDPFAQELYEAIQLFVENQVDVLVTEDSINYNVVLGLDMLGVLEEYVSQEDVLNYIDFTVMTNWNDYVKAAYLLDSVGVDNTPAITYLNDSLNTVPEFGYSSALSVLLKYGTSVSNFSSFETTVLDYYTINTPYDLGVDSGGMALIALSNYDTTLVDAYIQWISDDQLLSGGFQTRDSVWGEVTYPGTENASSMSQIILALVANGVDPTGVDYTKEGNNLVTRLMEFQNEDGSFDYLYGDETSDLMFSTPQAFVALVVYQEYLNNGGNEVNPY